VEWWNIEFREDKKFYPKSPLKHNLPPFLDAYLVAVTAMKEYGQANLTDLTIELMHSYLHDTVIKSLVLEGNTKLSDKEYEVEAKKFIANYGLICISIETVYRWMQGLGSSMKPKEKDTSLMVMKRRQP
jgi:hypothetical protein